MTVLMNTDRQVLTETEALDNLAALVKTPIDSYEELKKAYHIFNNLNILESQYITAIDILKTALKTSQGLLMKYELYVKDMLPKMVADKEKAANFFHYYMASRFFSSKSGNYNYYEPQFDKRKFNKFISSKDEFCSVMPGAFKCQCKCYFDELERLIEKGQALLKSRNIFLRKSKKEGLFQNIADNISILVKKIELYNFVGLNQSASVGYETISCSNPPIISRTTCAAKFTYYTITNTPKDREVCYPMAQLELIKLAVLTNDLSLTTLTTGRKENSAPLSQARESLTKAEKEFIEEADSKGIIDMIVTALIDLQIAQRVSPFSATTIDKLLEDFPGIESDTVMTYICNRYSKKAPMAEYQKALNKMKA